MFPVAITKYQGKFHFFCILNLQKILIWQGGSSRQLMFERDVFTSNCTQYAVEDPGFPVKET